MCTVYCRYYTVQYLVTSLLIVLLSITVLNFFRSFRILSLQNVIYSILLQKCWSKGKTYLNVMIILCKKCTVDSWELFLIFFVNFSNVLIIFLPQHPSYQHPSYQHPSYHQLKCSTKHVTIKY